MKTGKDKTAFKMPSYKTSIRTSIMPEAMLETSLRDEMKLAVVFRSERLGCGDAELGDRLVLPYFKALLNLPLPPQSILFYNTAVRLLTADSPVIDACRQLQSKGCELLACNLSLQHLGLVSSLQAGEISTLELMLERQLKADKILWP